jgi:outer membrane protein assembly complex protein YaeT
MKKKFVKKIAIAIGCLFLVITLVLLLVHMRFVKQKILYSILHNLEKTQGIQLSVGSFDYNLLNLRFTLKQVVLQSQEDRPFSPVFQAERIKVNIPLSLILKRRLRIQNLEVINPKIHIQIDQDGKHNLPFQTGPNKSRQVPIQLPEFIINRLVFQNAEVQFSDERQNLSIGLSEGWMRVNWQGKGIHSLLLETLQPGFVEYLDESYSLEKLMIRAAVGYGAVDIKELILNLAGNEFELSGRIMDFASLDFEGNLNGHLDLDRIRPLLNTDGLFLGKVDFRSELKGPLKAMAAQVHLKSEDLSIGPFDKVDASAELSWRDDSLQILSLDLKERRGEFHGYGSLHPLSWDKGNHLKTEWKGLDVEILSNFFHSPYPFSSYTAGFVDVSWKGLSLNDITGECDIRFSPKNGKDKLAKGTPVKGRIFAKADSGKISITFQNVSVLEASLQGKFVLSSETLSGNFSLETKNIGKLMPTVLASSESLKEENIQRLDLDGQIFVSGELEGTTRNPTIRLNAKSEGLEILKAKGIRLNGTILFDSHSVDVESLQVQDGEGKIEITGTYPLKPSGKAMRFDVSGEDLALERIFGLLGLRMPATGTVGINSVIEGNKQSPGVRLKLIVSDPFLCEERFERLEATAHYRSGKVILDSLRVSNSSGHLEASGFYEILSKEFDIRLSADGMFLQGIKVSEYSEVLKAKVDIDFTANGTLEKPNIVVKGILRQVFVGTRALGDFQFNAQSIRNELVFKFIAPVFSSTIEGSVSLHDPRLLNAELNINQMRLEDFKNRIQLLEKHNFSGSISSQVRMNMDLTDPRKSLAANAKIEQIQLKSGQHHIQNSGPILLSYGQEILSIENLMMVGTGTRVEAKGSLSMTVPSPSGLMIHANVDLSSLGNFLPAVDCGGFLKMESQLIGSLNNLEVSAIFDLSESQFHFHHVPLVFENIKSRIKIEKNIIRIDSFSMCLANSRFEMEGDVPFESLPLSLPAKLHVFEDREAQISLDIQNLDFNDLRPLFVSEIAQQINGRVKCGIEIKGKSLQLEELSARAIFKTIELDVMGIPFSQEATSELLFRGGTLLIEKLSFQEGENRFSINGTAGLTGSKDLNLSIGGELGLSVLSAFMKEGFVSGKTRFQVQATQNFISPNLQGFIEIQDGRFHRIYPRIFLEQVNGRIKFGQDRIEIEGIQGNLNGGKIVIAGSAGFREKVFHDTEIDIKNENSLFDYPTGLLSQVSSELKFLSDGKVHRLAGKVTVVDARYNEDFRVGSAVSRLLRRGSIRDAFREPNPYLKNLNLNIDIDIANSLIIDNNISKAEISADLKLIGTVYNPSLAGRASVTEGGEVYFSQNTFVIEQGAVDFVNPMRIEPDLNLTARTQVQDYDIRLILQGTPDKFSASLVSDPPLSEPNIISLLVTGRTLESASAQVLSVAGNTALSYINSAITGRIEQATARALGLDSVRIDASLVSTEENPEARITVGQHLASDFELIFSQDLKDARNQTWMANYNPLKSFNIQGVKRDNNEFNLAVRHEILFGLKAVPQLMLTDKLGKKDLVMGDIQLEGKIGLPEAEIYQNLKLRKGKRVNFAKLQENLDRIRRLYRRKNYLGFTLSTKREERDGRLNLIVHIDSGPKILLEYEGASVPKKLKKDIVDTWFGSSFGQLAREDIEQRIRVHFLKKRYYQVAVQSRERQSDRGERILVFQISRGARFGRPNIRYEGNLAISEKAITTHLEKSKLVNAAFYQPTEVVKSIEDLYIRLGYLRPKVRLPVVRFEPGERRGYIDLFLEEGTRFKVENIKIQGVHFFEENQILSEVGVHPGDIVSSERFNQAELKIQDLYVQKGFNDVRVQSDVEIHPEKGVVDLIIEVEENPQGIIEEIRITGNLLTKKRVIQREIKFKVGDVINFLEINETRKKLYDLGIFERVNIDVLPLDQVNEGNTGGSKNQVNRMKPYGVLIDVRELRPYRLRYGLQYDTDYSFGVLANLVDRNFLGNAHLLGTSIRLNRDERDARAFFRSPYFFSRKINTEFFLFYNKTIKPSFTLDRAGFTLQQQIKITESSMISYNYSFERINTFYPVLEGIQDFETTDRIGTINVAFTRDTRDDILNAKRGMFLSQSIRYSPGLLGSNKHFIRYFGQYNAYKKLSDFLTYASALRIGLGKGLNEDLPPSERFFAGGGTTIRGFKKDELGPKDSITELPLGGDAVFILNQELRFPIFKKFGGVFFLDLGNVYPKISDFDLFDIRKTAGFGLRLHTPFVLVRFDWGFKLDRKHGEALSQIFFSIGQAF